MEILILLIATAAFADWSATILKNVIKSYPMDTSHKLEWRE